MGTTTIQTSVAMWSCEPFIDEDGHPYIRLGMHGDDGSYAAVNVSPEELVRSSRFFGDAASRMDEAMRAVDTCVELGALTLHQRDEYLRQRFRALTAQLAVTPPPASP
jgi:hypothetical protein